MSHFVIACGGTGGHLSPGISLAESLIALGHETTLIVSRKNIDARLLQKYPHLRFETAPGTGLSYTPAGFFRFLLSQIQAVIFAAGFVLRRKPDVYISFGGFLTLGMALVCRLTGVPVVLHEANRVPGRAVRMLSGIATRVYLPPGVKIGGLPPMALRHAGFPVRKEIVPVPRRAARLALGMPESGPMVLVLGGSQGASALNNWTDLALDRLGLEGVSVLCVTGPGKSEARSDERRSRDGRRVVFRHIPFCDRMADALSAADIVVSRAGAGSIAEFMACATPAILVPYPHAADNHQEENARFFELQGGGYSIRESGINRLTDEVVALLANERLQQGFRANLTRMAGDHDWHVMVDELVQLAREQTGRSGTARAGESAA